VLADGTNRYLYGMGCIAQYGASGAQYFLGDALGSVRQLVDADEQVLLAQSYAPYGELLESVGEGESSYGFAAETRDPTGLIYLRARYYSSYLNQFIQPDPIVPDPYQPWEWNRYTYSRNNPVNLTDPSGMLSCYNGGDSNCQISAELVNQFAETTKANVRSGAVLPVEGFAQTVDYAYRLFDQDYHGMM
jgi:RHS repeat-associated protein